MNVVELKPQTLKKLEPLMHNAWSRGNPIDLVGDALPEKYEKALEVLLHEDYVCGAIVIQTLQTMTKSMEDARIVIKASEKFKKPIVGVFMGGVFTRDSIRLLQENGIPNYNDPMKAARAFAALVA